MSTGNTEMFFFADVGRVPLGVGRKEPSGHSLWQALVLRSAVFLRRHEDTFTFAFDAGGDPNFPLFGISILVFSILVFSIWIFEKHFSTGSPKADDELCIFRADRFHN